MADSTKTSQANEADSMLELAEKLRDGKECTQDVNRAFVLAYEAVAKGRRAKALRTLAYFYRRGLFAAKDHKKANELYCRSANTGSKFAYYQLGKSYLEGWGVKKDLAAAKFLFEKAIEKGVQKASDEIKKIPDSVRSDKSGISGYTGEPDKGSLPDYVTADYEKAKRGTLWDANCHCHTCHDKGSVTCPECGGKKEFECKDCHGKGHHNDCYHCGSTGKARCSDCGGSGKVPVDCPVCHHTGKVTKERYINCALCHGTGEQEWGRGQYRTCPRCEGSGQIKERYQDICPNCHGDYKGFKGKKTCSACSGTGKVRCSYCSGTGKRTCTSCNGRGKIRCKTCGGDGSVKCPECKKREDAAAAAKRKQEAAESERRYKAAEEERERTRESYQNRSVFMAVGLAFGLLGVHYAYVRRWFMFLIQIILTTFGVIKFVVPAIGAQIENLTMPYSIKLNEAGYSWLGLVVQNPLSLAVLWCLFGVIFIRRDGTNHKMTFNGGKAVSRRAFIIFSIVCIAYFFLLAMCYHLPLRLAWLAVSGIPFIYACRWKFFFVNLLAVLACACGLGGNVMLNIYGWGYLLSIGYVAKEL